MQAKESGGAENQRKIQAEIEEEKRKHGIFQLVQSSASPKPLILTASGADIEKEEWEQVRQSLEEEVLILKRAVRLSPTFSWCERAIASSLGLAGR